MVLQKRGAERREFSGGNIFGYRTGLRFSIPPILLPRISGWG